MRLRGLSAFALVLALLLAPPASAGSSARPDLVDERDDQRGGPDADMIAAWLDPREDGLRFGIRMAEYDDTHHVYWVLLELEETGREIAAIVGYGSSGELRSALTTGPDSGGLDGRTSIFFGGEFDRVANGGLVDLTVDETRKGVDLEATIPWGAFEELQPGVVIDEWGAGNTRFERGQWTGNADGVSSEEPFVADVPSPLARAFSGDLTFGVFPIMVPGWALPLIVALCTFAGAGGGYAIARRKPAAPAAPAAVAVPVRPAVPPPGERFRAAPPPRK